MGPETAPREQNPAYRPVSYTHLDVYKRQGDRRASAVERASTDAVEAAVLAGSVGRDFSGSVVDVTSKGMPVVQLLDPAVVGLAAGSAKPGTCLLYTSRCV